MKGNETIIKQKLNDVRMAFLNQRLPKNTEIKVLLTPNVLHVLRLQLYSNAKLTMNTSYAAVNSEYHDSLETEL